VLREGLRRADNVLPGRLPGRLLLSGQHTVLFVCVENACRSLMAEAFFNANPPPGWRAESAGTAPRAATDPRTGPALRQLGVVLPKHPPQLLTAAGLAGASLMVTMGSVDESACPVGSPGLDVVDWGIPDPRNAGEREFRAIRDAIRRRVDELRAALLRDPRTLPA
jgi:arsenate reductase (thioredoxin)